MGLHLQLIIQKMLEMHWNHPLQSQWCKVATAGDKLVEFHKSSYKVIVHY